MRAMRYFAALVILSMIPLLPSSAPAAVYVEKSATTVRYKVFDPAKPPADMPRLNPPEAAVTVCEFGLKFDPRGDVVSRERGPDGSWSVVIAVSAVSIYPRQNVVIWTPKGVSDKLKAHEEGHRKLDEMMYKKLAENGARAAGAEIDGHRFTGLGSTVARATADARQNMIQQLWRVYLAQTAAVNDEINNTYDAITQHGTNDIPEAQAIKQALERYDQDHAATRPATESPGEKK